MISSLALLLVCAPIPPMASAVTTRLPLGFSPITGAASEVTISVPGGIALDETSGNVFLNDGFNNSPKEDSSVTDILGAEGGVPAGLVSPFQLTGVSFESSAQNAVAIDNSAMSPSKGTLYVVVSIGDHAAIKKFTRSPSTEKYEATGELSYSGSVAAGATVDTHGNLFVVDFTSRSVVKFSPAGVLLRQVSLAGSVGRPTSVAVDAAGDLFVARAGSGEVFKYPADGSGEFSGSVFQKIVTEGATDVAVDPATNRLFVALGDHVNQYDATTLVKQLEFGAGTLTTTTRVAVNAAVDRIYVADVGKKNVSVFGPAVTVAGVETGPATDITPTKATLHGSVNPDNIAVTECKFQYLTDAAYKANGNSYSGPNVPLTKACEGSIPTDGADHPVTAALTGLSGDGGTYHFRLVASNVNGANATADRTFTVGNIVETRDATANSGTKATLNGAVFPDNIAVTECKFQYLTDAAYKANGNSYSGPNVPLTKACSGSIPTDGGEHPVTAAVTKLQPNGTTYHFRIVVVNGIGTFSGADKSFTTPDTVITGAGSSILDHAATVNGTITTDGVALTECKFEYGPTASYGSSQDCVPAFGAIPNDSSFHAVSASLTGLAGNTKYHFRLVAASANGKIIGGDKTFTTLGSPQVSGGIASPVTGTTATLLSRVNPSGFSTTYHFEWGTDKSYGSRLPLTEDPAIGSGTAPVAISTDLSGLQPGTTYHFRVVATNASGSTNGPDVVFTTNDFTELNAAGLPDNRNFELVSPPDKKPQGAVMTSELPGLFVNFQVADDGQSVAFPILGGLEDTNSGGDTSYLAKRSSDAWHSTKISPQSLVPAPTAGQAGNAASGFVNYNSSDLSCSVINTPNPLTADTPVADVELGVYNLYRRNSDGSHTLITKTVPANPEILPMVGVGNPITTVAGASSDCSMVYFVSKYNYLPNASGLYEWDEGTLRDAGRLPNGATPVDAITSGSISLPVALGGEYGEGGSRLNSVSRDGSRVFFSAKNGPSPTGKIAVFVRSDGNPSVEASRKQGGTNDSLGARYEVASPDGSHLFFTATYGLTAKSSNGPAEDCAQAGLGAVKACDLYDYNANTGELRNLSADTNASDSKGAVVQGVIAVSDDGSSVYFSARGQLVPGEGKTYAENIAGAGSANVYLARSGELSYVATIAASDTDALVRSSSWTAEATPDGQRLLFASRANVTSYNSGGVSEAYLYDAVSGTVRCVSCRPDGLPPVGGGVSLRGGFQRSESKQEPSRKMSDDGRRVFFTMPGVLAPGAVSGNNNIYEWEQGQIYLLVSGPASTAGGLEVDFASTKFTGVSRSGDDVFFRTAAQLDPHDTDFSLDIYDVRVDGGFPPPMSPPTPCDPAADQCQGVAAAQPPSANPASTGVIGPGNPPPPPKPCVKGKVRKHGKCVKRPHKHGKHKQSKQRRAANANHGGAK